MPTTYHPLVKMGTPDKLYLLGYSRRELTTPARLAWGRAHTVPSNVEYLSIAATMGDPSTEDGAWSLST